jgi:terminal uridylyltransferase
MRAYRIFQARPDRAIVALSQLCEERQEEELPPLGGVSYIPARLTPLPPQTPYTVGSSSLRPQVVPAPIAEEPASKPDDADGRSTPLAAPVAAPHAPVLEHMAPKRGKWTSPPPPDAPLADLASFEDRLGYGLELATAPTDARQRAHTENSSASNSEIFTDDGKISDVADLDDVRSVRSFSEESSTPNWSPRPSSVAYSYSHETDVESKRTSLAPLVSALRPRPGNATRGNLQPRGRRAGKAPEDPGDSPTPTHASYGVLDAWAAGPSRRSASGPARPMNTRYSMPPTPVEGFMPMHPLAMQRLPFIRPTAAAPASTVFYETSTGKEQRARADPGALAPGGAGPSTAAYAAQPYVAMLAPYVHPMYPHYLMDPRMFAHPTAASPTMSPLDPVSPTAFTRWATPSRDQLNALAGESLSRTRNREPKTPTPTASSHNSGSAPRRRGSHAHTHSTATVVPADSGSRAEGSSRSGGKARSRSRSRTSTAGTSPASTPVAEVPPSLRTTSRSATKSRSSGVEPKAKDDVPQEAPAEDSTHSAPGKLATLDTSARWSPAPRRSKSPHSPGTDSPAPSSPSSSFVTSPSTSPPSPANVKDVAVTDPVLVLDVVVEQNLSPEQETAKVKSLASGLHPEAITEVPAAESTPIEGMSVQESTELPGQQR